ncbi:MAG: hypothetical protein P4L33_01650 [Capsulimonadaceae bacterium]|nr:hypothetical protein [Capsulimonadaceae bacterium]
MSVSIHDNHLLSYCVFAEKRQIVFHTEYRDAPEPEHTDVLFDGVEAYCFNHDNFDNILFDISEVHVETIITEDRALFEQGKPFGWPGPWRRSGEDILHYFIEREVRGFQVTSSSGMSGWVLAKSVAFVSLPAP